MTVAKAIDSVLSPAGWAYASSPPVEPGDPGRFNALFGRDSLIFALQVLLVRPEVAPATLRALAALQGKSDDPETEEQPGRILHEYRPVAPNWLVEAGWPVRDGGICYYGTSDATSWFLVLLAATGDVPLQTELAASRAAASRWLESALVTGGGLVRSGPRTFRGGLAQQGWRDSLDSTTDKHGGGIVDGRGRMPVAALADADSQAAAVAALDALAILDPAAADHWRSLASKLRSTIATEFTVETMAIDGDRRRVYGAGSQLGWLLWADALCTTGAEAAAERLTRDDVLTPFGVRTLASTHPAFRVGGYHRGAVWPFDNWIAWAALKRHGHVDEAERLRSGVQEALSRLGRYPELYAVDIGGLLHAVPVANRVQAWTIGAAIAFDNDWTGRPAVANPHRP